MSIWLKDKRIVGFEIKGHAGYADKGYDIICSAVSAIGYTAVGYFENKYNPQRMKDKISYIEMDGYMKFTRPKTTDSNEILKDDAVLEAMVLGLKQVEYSYGSKFVRIKEEEV
ncbi:MAG: ribosomal-processing cysteine protease Prp [Clostridiaceae bacterium]|nr:ribosomal-processing cysteine protease Prp [Clostridiaceae bacterium]